LEIDKKKIDFKQHKSLEIGKKIDFKIINPRYSDRNTKLWKSTKKIDFKINKVTKIAGNRPK